MKELTWEDLLRAGILPETVAPLVDAGLEERLHALLEDPASSGAMRSMLAMALQEACGVDHPESPGRIYPLAVLVAAAVPPGAEDSMPQKLPRLARAVSSPGLVRRLFGTEDVLDAVCTGECLVPLGRAWASEEIWRGFARSVASGLASVSEKLARGWRVLCGPPLVRESVHVASAVPVAVRSLRGGFVPRDVSAVSELWEAAAEDLREAGVDPARAAVAVPRRTWVIPSDFVALAASTVAVQRGLSAEAPEFAADRFIQAEVASRKAACLVSVRCGALSVEEAGMFDSAGQPLGHPYRAMLLRAALAAAAAAGGAVRVCPDTGEVLVYEMDGCAWKRPGGGWIPGAGLVAGTH